MGARCTSHILKELSAGSDGAVAALVQHVSRHRVADAEVAEIARVLAASGPSLHLSGVASADLASTGGPSSLSTLLGPLYLRAVGLTVPTLAVPGRPAGGVDVLATIPGYETTLTASQVTGVLERCGHAHLVAGHTWAPLDAATFAYRQRVGAQQQEVLVIASLLAKKVATSVRHVGLDVRIAAHGNFGATRTEARGRAERFVAVAEILGIRAGCLLTDGRGPYQPYIGRGEALVALHEVLTGRAGEWLDAHDDLCWLLASRVTELTCGSPQERPSHGDLRSAFTANLTAQGSSWSAFEAQCEHVVSQPSTTMTASRAGFVRIDLSVIRTVLVEGQRRSVSSGSQFGDPCGVTLLVPHGAPVEEGWDLARLRSEKTLTPHEQDAVRCAIVVEDDPPEASEGPEWLA